MKRIDERAEHISKGNGKGEGEAECEVSVKMSLLLEHDGVAAGTETCSHLVVELQPEGRGIEHIRPRLSVVFVLDVSGSMAGPPIEHVQSSVTTLLGLLDADDLVGIVGFSDSATEIAALEALAGERRALLSNRVRRMEAGGATNMEAGLNLAKQILGPRQAHERQLIVLLSDGRPNRGAADADGLASIAASMRPDVATVTLGYGPHHAEDLLAHIANAGSGEYFYVEDPLESDDAFARAVGAQGDVVADAVRLYFRPGEGVEIRDFHPPVKPRFGPRGLIVDHADLLAKRRRCVVARLDLRPPAHVGPWLAGEVELSYRLAGSTTTYTHEQSLHIPVRHDPGELVSTAHMHVLLATAESARAEARALADRGNYDGAAAIIRDLIARVHKAPGFRPGDGSVLADALEQLIDERIAYERKPSMETYRNFKRETLGVAMQDGGWHHSARALSNQRSQSIASGTRGELPRAYLLVRGPDADEQRIPLAGEASIGRVAGNQVVLPQGKVSKRHTRLVGRKGKYVVVDLKSTNGTYINGKKLCAPRALKPGDQLHIGDYELHYCEDSD